MKSKMKTWGELKREHYNQEQIDALKLEAHEELVADELIARDLRELREFTQKTQVDVASEQGVTQSYVSRLEHKAINSMVLKTLRETTSRR